MSGILGLVLGNFAPAAGGGVTVIQSFTGTGEWVCPTGVTQVEYLIVGGGGGSGSQYGGGGGAGGFRTGTGLSVTAGDTYTVTVGAGGAGGLLVMFREVWWHFFYCRRTHTENPSGAGQYSKPMAVAVAAALIISGGDGGSGGGGKWKPAGRMETPSYHSITR
jgi:hypothetical protein